MNLEHPYISIVTPFYNQSDTFWETYNAVVMQTYPNWEWLIIDDGSDSADALEVLRELNQVSDKKIKVVSLQENSGLPKARNIGVAKAAYEFIFFLDSDDIIELDYLEKASLTLQLNKGFSFVNSWSTGFGMKTYNWQAGFDKKADFLKQNWVAFSGLFRKEIFNNIQFDEDLKYGLEDWDFWLQAAYTGYWGYTIPEYLFHYRINSNVITKWPSWDRGPQQASFKNRLKKKYGTRLSSAFPSVSKTKYSLEEISSSVNLSLKISPLKPIILVVLPWLEPGGVEQFTLSWMTRLVSNFDFIIVTTEKGDHVTTSIFKPISRQIYHLNSLVDATGYPLIWDYIITYWQISIVVISHSLSAYYILPYLKSRFTHLKVIDVIHLVEVHWMDGGYAAQAIRYDRYIDFHLAASRSLLQWMVARNVEKNKILLAHINVDPNEIQPMTHDQRIQERMAFFPPIVDPDILILAFSGRLTDQKNVLILPEIAKLLVEKGIKFLFIVSGDGPEREQLEEAIYQSRLTSYFLMLGQLSHAQNIKMIQLADIFVLPSKWEGIATVLYEAMACGIAVVASNTGGQSELIDPTAGVLVEINNQHALARDFSAAIANLSHNRNLIQTLGENARKRIELNFSLDTTIATIRALLARLQNNTSFTISTTQNKTLNQYYTDISAIPENNLSISSRLKKLRSIRMFRAIMKVLQRKRPPSYLWDKIKRNIG